MWPTLDELRRLTTGTVLTLHRHGPCRFVRLRQKRAHFVRQSDEKRVNLWFDDLTPPPALAAVRDTDTPPSDEDGARTEAGAPDGNSDGGRVSDWQRDGERPFRFPTAT